MNKEDKLLECTMKMLKEYKPEEIDEIIDLPEPTTKTNFEGFDTNYAGNSDSSNASLLLPTNPDRKWALLKKWDKLSCASDEDYWHYNDAYISEMTPEDYFYYCYRYIFKSMPPENMDKALELPEINKENVFKYADLMEQGTKFRMPFIDFRRESQEGRHRALASYLNGYKTIPVVIMI